MCSVSQFCPTLCDPIDPPGFSVHGISQASILDWVAIFSSRRSSRPGDQTHISRVSCIAGEFFTTEPLGKPFVFSPCIHFFFIDSHPIHLSIKLCDIIYLMFHFTNFIHILFQLAVCVQYYNVVHKKLVHLFGLLTGSMWSSLIIILYQSLI